MKKDTNTRPLYQGFLVDLRPPLSVNKGGRSTLFFRQIYTKPCSYTQSNLTRAIDANSRPKANDKVLHFFCLLPPNDSLLRPNDDLLPPNNGLLPANNKNALLNAQNPQTVTAEQRLWPAIAPRTEKAKAAEGLQKTSPPPRFAPPRLFPQSAEKKLETSENNCPMKWPILNTSLYICKLYRGLRSRHLGHGMG